MTRRSLFRMVGAALVARPLAAMAPLRLRVTPAILDDALINIERLTAARIARLFGVPSQLLRTESAFGYIVPDDFMRQLVLEVNERAISSEGAVRHAALQEQSDASRVL